ncbi:hypothetical protein HPP92_009296 [Vanilla planifolia]|uniref:SET domain-containing protein n=1 Tax=Vanilla planifolia TaxID=51239 RepID=A0A835RFY1_VANPL|nr:hypothetical protein HPP92_009296 [Vanilla planifolia]
METEMEMRALEATPLSSDLTPPIPPISVALHDKYLASHCTICFRRLSNPSSVTTTLDAYTISLMHSCSACSARVKYCSPNCYAADSNGHVSSGECGLFFLLRSTAEDSTDLRAALRLLHYFECLGILPSPKRHESSGRIGGLLVAGLVEIMEEAGELAERIREGATLMARARHTENFGDFPHEKVSVEEEMLWAVMLNGVEVEIGELGAVGVAVYGPWFSWFNHSCLPNACYRFDLSPHHEELQHEGSGSFKVFPASSGNQGSHVWKRWNFVDSSIVPGLCWFGPRIIIRSIKPLNKSEEVCITYMDLLQPKVMRHLDLWSRYHFICHCKRCCISPQMYIDFILNCDTRSLNCANSTSLNPPLWLLISWRKP